MAWLSLAPCCQVRPTSLIARRTPQQVQLYRK